MSEELANASAELAEEECLAVVQAAKSLGVY